MTKTKQEFKVFITMREGKETIKPSTVCNVLYDLENVDGVSVGEVKTNYNDWARAGLHGIAQNTAQVANEAVKNEEVRNFILAHRPLKIKTYIKCTILKEAEDIVNRFMGKDVSIHKDVYDDTAIIHYIPIDYDKFFLIALAWNREG